MDVFHLLVPQQRAVTISRVISQQLAIVLEMRAAAARIRDDGVELLRRELLDLFAGELLGHVPFAIVRVQGAATELLMGRKDFAPVAREHFHRVEVDVAEDQVLRAADQHGDAVTLASHCRRDRRNQFSREPGLNVGRNGFQLAQPLGQQLEYPAAADELLQTHPLIEANEAADQAQMAAGP